MSEKKDITCPKCGSADDIHFGEYVFRRIPFGRVENGKILFDNAGDTMVWDACKEAHLFCGSCCVSFPIPEELEFTFE